MNIRLLFLLGLSIVRHTMFSEQLPRLSNTIRFQDSYSKEWCEIKIDVNQHKSGFYELTYTAVYSKDNEDARHAHPLYQTSIRDDDEWLLEGLYVAASKSNYVSYNSVYDVPRKRAKTL